MKEIQTDNGTCNGCRSCGAGCTCGGMHGYHGHPVLRIILALVILTFVFMAGMKLGELKAELGLGYERHGMMMERSNNYMYGEGNMMPVVIPGGPMIPAPAPTTKTKIAPTTTSTTVTQ
jgi:hypothetical protein